MNRDDVCYLSVVVGKPGTRPDMLKARSMRIERSLERPACEVSIEQLRVFLNAPQLRELSKMLFEVSTEVTQPDEKVFLILHRGEGLEE